MSYNSENPGSGIIVPDPGSPAPQWDAIQRGEGSLFLGYRRAREYDNSDGEGQDRCAITICGQTVIAVLADGVSQSFAGEIAAYAVVQTVTEALTQAIKTARIAECFAQMPLLLQSAARHYAIDVLQKPLPDEIPDIRRELLEEMRVGGSQAVFGAFCYNMRSKMLTAVLLGDVRLRYLTPDGPQMLESGAMGRFTVTSDPNSPLNGIAVTTQLPVAVIENVEMAWIHSDGVPDSWGAAPSNLFDSNCLLEALNHWARKDDASIVGFASTSAISWAAQNEPPVISAPPSEPRLPFGLSVSRTPKPNPEPEIAHAEEQPPLYLPPVATEPEYKYQPQEVRPTKSAIPRLTLEAVAGVAVVCFVIGIMIGRNRPQAVVPVPTTNNTNSKPAKANTPTDQKALSHQLHETRVALKNKELIQSCNSNITSDLQSTIDAASRAISEWKAAHQDDKDE